MALINFGQPFGSPHQLINVPAPAGSQNAGQMQMQAMQQLGSVIGQGLAQKKQRGLFEQDQAAIQQYGQDMQQYEQYQQQLAAAEAGRRQGLAGQLPEGQAGPGFPAFVPQPQFPTMKSNELANAQAQMELKRQLMGGQQLSIGDMRAIQAQKTGAVPGTSAFERIVKGPEKTEKPLSPSQEISQLKLNKIQEFQAIPKEQRTPEQQATLNKMLVGQPLVEIGFGQPASASERTSIAEARASMDALDNLKTLFDSTQTTTGPIAGRVSGPAGLFGLTTDEQESFMAATSAFKNAVIKQITGAQMSEVEATRIMKQIPDIIDPSSRWTAKWQQTMRNIKMMEKRQIQIIKQSGLRVPTDTQVTPNAPKTGRTESGIGWSIE